MTRQQRPGDTRGGNTEDTADSRFRPEALLERVGSVRLRARHEDRRHGF